MIKYLTRKMISRSMAYEGSPERLVGLMKRAEAGERLTLCFLGGSITQGCASSVPETCYAYLVYDWFVKKFKKAEFTYINAGIGGTTSQFAVTRLKSDVMRYKPDFCMIEFSVNDAANSFFRESYEGVVRRLWFAENEPALLVMNNLFYDTGVNTQAEHNEIAEAYDITCISVRDAVRPEIEEGRIERTVLSGDGLHPNDNGHAILAALVEHYLEGIYDRYLVKGEEPAAPIVTIGPISSNGMEHLKRIQNRSERVECRGFVPDRAHKKNMLDLFKNGWKGTKVGDAISFSFEGTELAIQYLKTINRPAPIALAIIDNDTEHPYVLDANFEENWGNHIHIDTLLYHNEPVDPGLINSGYDCDGDYSPEERARHEEIAAISQRSSKKQRHTVEIRITEAHEEDKSSFYLVSFITA